MIYSELVIFRTFRNSSEMNFIKGTMKSLLVATTSLRVAIFVNIRLIRVVNPLLHLVQRSLEHLCEITTHGVDSLLQLLQVGILLLDHQVFLLLLVLDVLLKFCDLSLLCRHDCLLVGDLFVRLGLHGAVDFGHLLDDTSGFFFVFFCLLVTVFFFLAHCFLVVEGLISTLLLEHDSRFESLDLGFEDVVEVVLVDLSVVITFLSSLLASFLFTSHLSNLNL